VNRRTFCKRIAKAGLALPLVSRARWVRSEETVVKPNIIFIMADDLGWADIGCYGQKDIETPNLDQMAAEGIRFTQHYAGNSLCAPSRTSLMTGKHMGHASCRENQSGKIGENEPTLGTVLKQAGYATGCIGKWGCGKSLLPTDPNDHGFDHFYGYVNTGHAHNYYPSYLYRDGEKDYTTNVPPENGEGTGDKEGTGDASEKNEYSHDLLTEDALKFIEERQQPFFLHLCYTIPHVNNEAAVPLEVPDLWTYEDKDWVYAKKAYASMISRMDYDIGRIRKKLEDLGIAENTLVLFTGDNGPHNKGGYDPSLFNSTGHLRSNKFSEYEGGIREPLIGWWPKHIQPGTVSDHVSAFWDFLPTVCAVAGISPPDDIDGISYLPSLLGQENQTRHDYLYWERYLNIRGKRPRTRQTLRWGDWKGMRTIELNKTDDPSYFPSMELYNLDLDESESNDVAGANPEIVAQIEILMADAHVPDSNGNLPPIPEYVSTVITEEKTSTPETFSLEQNYPNPFNSVTNIRFSIPNAGNVKLNVYNMSGKKIKTLVDVHKSAGIYNVKWNGTDSAGREMTSGIYFYKLQMGSNVQVKKMLFMK